METAQTPLTQKSSTYSVVLGEFRVTAILESVVHAPADLLIGVSDEHRRRRQADSMRGAVPLVTISCFLIDTGTHHVLVDTGLGGAATATSARLLPELATLGLGPEQISHVLLTHLHADHAGGILSEAGDSCFPQAEFVAHWAEREYCFEGPKPTVRPAVAEQHEFAQSLRPLLPRFRWVDEGPVLPGIELLHLPGHTPGHSGFRLHSGRETLLLWGDIVHQPLHQFPDPAIGTSFDVDPRMAINTRRMVMAHAAATRELIAGSHTDFPTFGHVKADGDGFRFVPLVWTSEIAGAPAI